METQDEKSAPKEIGSNLTGAALKGKPGHERDVTAQTVNDEAETKKEEGKKATDQAGKHVENTDALLGDVQKK